jgi:hypothetical protein
LVNDVDDGGVFTAARVVSALGDRGIEESELGGRGGTAAGKRVSDRSLLCRQVMQVLAA